MKRFKKKQISAAFKDCLEEGKIPESVVLTHVTLMAQQSLDPDLYEMYCKVHDRIVENRKLPLDKLF